MTCQVSPTIIGVTTLCITTPQRLAKPATPSLLCQTRQVYQVETHPIKAGVARTVSDGLGCMVACRHPAWRCPVPPAHAHALATSPFDPPAATTCMLMCHSPHPSDPLLRPAQQPGGSQEYPTGFCMTMMQTRHHNRQEAPQLVRLPAVACYYPPTLQVPQPTPTHTSCPMHVCEYCTCRTASVCIQDQQASPNHAHMLLPAKLRM